MKVLSIQQPWASLIVMGAKRIETRSWATKYRGPILIHASATFPKRNKELCATDLFRGFLSGVDPLPLGAIIGKAVLKDVDTSENILQDFDYYPGIYGVGERYFGDYSPGRFGWLLEEVERFANPIPAKGKLGLWEFE